ncbi:hypothetical protein RJ640_010409 [Escallonia rubra]|uniref:non-specific serine/threonine protein kinase n=1 Tax=Escallonia rubra TaxID=112253 RepID=A0AA88UCC2_9ASTE|nr:hypothetical protein RJ640_010409 [Escallonia rubra]
MTQIESSNHGTNPGTSASGRRHPRVTGFNLSGQGISGHVSPSIGNLSFLRFIELKGNSFVGEIPQEIGKIPGNMSHCSELRFLDMARNNLVDKIPTELGTIRNSFGNLTALEELYLAESNLEGSIPSVMGQVPRLNIFAIAINKFQAITVFAAADNLLTGSLPADVGFTLPNLQKIGIGGNKMGGEIPVSLMNATQLELLDISGSSYVGQVPTNLGGLQKLQWMNIGSNHLGSNKTNDLNFIASLSNCSNLQLLYFGNNNFRGELPNSIGNLSIQLQRLALGQNHISGKIPAGLQNLANNLNLLGMEENLFSGTIPDYLGKFQKLQVLGLYGNTFSGNIPTSFGNLTELYKLQLSRNRLQGIIPSNLWNCKHLTEVYMQQNELIGFIPISSLSNTLNLSRNSLTGSLPLEVGRLISTYALDVSENKLAGEIPQTVGGCLGFEYLMMQGNYFQGMIPSALASLKGIRYLDLSRNNLSGKIPKDLENLPNLQYLNLSFNELKGEVPIKGVFAQAGTVSLLGNDNLCGGIPELQLPSCLPKGIKKSRSSKMKVVTVILSTILLFITLASFAVLCWSINRRNDRSSITSEVDRALRVSYHELYQATSGFSSKFLIGSGSFGFVYKGRLDQHEGRQVAIKVLNLQRAGASKSFMVECNSLRNIRHRNLAKILSCCSSIDLKGNELKALIYEFMENGSLDTWLHPEVAQVQSSRTLNYIQRLNAAIDVASALCYLHDECETPVIHCDLKPSNILLDHDMSAQISDFGLARLLPNITRKYSQQGDSSIVVNGSIGYAALEYGMGGEASMYGDIYSYVILLLEMFTGRRPTDDVFQDGLTLHNHVKMALPGEVMSIIDPILIAKEREAQTEATATEEEEDDDYDRDGILEGASNHVLSLSCKTCLVSILEIGLACSTDAIPKARMKLKDVLRELHRIKAYKEKVKKKATALRFIQQGISQSIYPRIFGIKKAKEAWEILQKEFQGSEKVISIKLQTFWSDFDNISKKENELVRDFFSRFAEIVNQIIFRKEIIKFGTRSKREFILKRRFFYQRTRKEQSRKRPRPRQKV